MFEINHMTRRHRRRQRNIQKVLPYRERMPEELPENDTGGPKFDLIPTEYNPYRSRFSRPAETQAERSPPKLKRSAIIFDAKV